MDKVLVFGSFTEDELLSFQTPQPLPNVQAATQNLSSKPTKLHPSSNISTKVPNGDVPKPTVTNDPGLATNDGSASVKPKANGVSSWTPIALRPIVPGNGIFLPRGLVNCHNTCFLNSTLQALLACSPFWHLLQALRNHTIPRDEFPVLHAFASFAREFVDAPPTQFSPSNRDVAIQNPLTPSMFDPVLHLFDPARQAGGQNRQQDAQEFLSFLMNHMHEELLKFEGGDKNSAANVAGDDEWETVGKKNRTAVTRTHTVQESALREIFGGQQQSVVKTKGFKPSATVEPFYLLHLEISSRDVRSVDDALKFYGASESIEGYKCLATGKSTDASRSMKLQSLPKILILHLKRFSYGAAKGTDKVHKGIRFPGILTVDRELLASSSGSNVEARKYELVATITHHGRNSSTGHYTADAKQPDGKWLRFDDSKVKVVSLKDVFEQDLVYMLFYRKCQL